MELDELVNAWRTRRLKAGGALELELSIFTNSLRRPSLHDMRSYALEPNLSLGQDWRIFLVLIPRSDHSSGPVSKSREWKAHTLFSSGHS
jgi:hypothetical protein